MMMMMMMMMMTMRLTMTLISCRMTLMHCKLFYPSNSLILPYPRTRRFLRHKATTASLKQPATNTLHAS